MLKKTRKQIITLGIAGIVSAGSLFSGIVLNSVYAQEETQAAAASEEAPEEGLAQKAEVTTLEANKGETLAQGQNQNNPEAGANSGAENSTATDKEKTDDKKEDKDADTADDESVKQTDDTTKTSAESEQIDSDKIQEKQTRVAAEEAKIAESEDNVKADMNQAAYPVNVNTDMSELSGMEWALSDQTVLANTDIKLYKIAYSEYLQIIENNGGMMGATQGDIWKELKNKAQLIEQWTAADRSRSLNLESGDYYISVNDSLYGLSAPKVFFNISDDLKTMREYDMSAAESEGIIAYKGSAQNSQGLLSVKPDGIDLWAKYVDPVIITKSIGGQELTEGTEIEVYKKDGDKQLKVDLIARNAATTFYSEGASYINTMLEHPGIYIIRCAKTPDGYEKFPDITVIAKTNEYGYPELEIDNKNINDAVIKGVAGGEPFYWRKNINPAVIEITMESETAVKADVQIMTRADFRFFNLRHADIDNWEEVAAEYNTVDGVENKLYRFSFETWKKMVEEITQIGGGGNAYINNMRTAIKERGEYITAWKSASTPYTVALKPSVYAVFNDKLDGNGHVTFFQVYEDGSVRYCPEYYSYLSEFGFETFEWGKSGAVDEGNLVYHDIVYYENRDTVTFKLSDKNGNNISGGSVIELYRKEGDKLTRVSIEKAKGGHYESDHFCGLLDYPGEFVIKCVSVPSGYKAFKDISFTVSRNEDGYPEYKITDYNGNTVFLKGIDLYGEYESPSYGAQETISALFDIVLEGEANSSTRPSSGNTSGGQNVKTIAQAGATSSEKVAAAQTGDTNFTAIYFIAAGAVAAVGVAAFALKRKRED